MLTLIYLPGILIKNFQPFRLSVKQKTGVKKTTVFFTHAREAFLPADFLNVDQRASYGQFSGEPNDIQLARFFLLDEADMEFINNRRGRANRLAVALLIGCVRFLGAWPHELLSIPANVQGARLENGIYGHSRFCNTDFDDKLACLNLSGV